MTGPAPETAAAKPAGYRRLHWQVALAMVLRPPVIARSEGETEVDTVARS